MDWVISTGPSNIGQEGKGNKLSSENKLYWNVYCEEALNIWKAAEEQHRPVWW